MNDLPPLESTSAPIPVDPSDPGRQEGVGLVDVLARLLDQVQVGLAVRDVANGGYVHVNAHMVELLGQTLGAHGQISDSAAAQWDLVRAADEAALARPDRASPLIEHRLERNGQRHEFLVARAVLPQPDGAAATQVCSLWADCTVQRQQQVDLQGALGQLERQQRANQHLRNELFDTTGRDGIASLFQTAQFYDQLRRELDLSSREQREFALVWIALDPLVGGAMAAGAPARAREQVLNELGTLLRGNTRAMDAACRLDDAHFAVLLSGVGLATAHSRMESLRRQCATHLVVMEGEPVAFSVSMGVASFPHTEQREVELVQAAQRALAEAQRRGGNQVALASVRFGA